MKGNGVIMPFRKRNAAFRKQFNSSISARKAPHTVNEAKKLRRAAEKFKRNGKAAAKGITIEANRASAELIRAAKNIERTAISAAANLKKMAAQGGPGPSTAMPINGYLSSNSNNSPIIRNGKRALRQTKNNSPLSLSAEIRALGEGLSPGPSPTNSNQELRKS